LPLRHKYARKNAAPVQRITREKIEYREKEIEKEKQKEQRSEYLCA
jgi:hypothetical protein